MSIDTEHLFLSGCAALLIGLGSLVYFVAQHFNEVKKELTDSGFIEVQYRMERVWIHRDNIKELPYAP